MTEHLHPALFALAVWWLSTGAILYMTGLPRRRVHWTMAGGSAAFAAALAASTPGLIAGLTMLAMLTVLGTLEHWFLVLPIRVDAL